MASSPALTGRTLAHYRVLEKIGAGGMGEVYRGHDSKLGRDVAIKVLPEAFAADAERLARFQREAQMLAALNHPHIAAIYGLEHADGVHCLILELVEGESLAQRLKNGPLLLADALAICRQIADALEAAHEKGIVHRDLKPANVNITPDGTVKVLDFGLAKAFGGDGVQSDSSNSPTLTSPATYGAVLVGTAAYMSPEQARGREVDRRADVWAFGCVLYELLTAHKAYDGETVSDTLAAVLRAEPDWSALPASTPAAVHKLLRRCLQKDPRKRLRDIGDVRLELEDIIASPGETPSALLTAAPEKSRWKRALPWAIAGIFIGATALAHWQLQREIRSRPAPVVTRFSYVLPAELGVGFLSRPAVAFSPDGRKLAYVAEDSRGQRLLHVHSLDLGTTVALESTASAYNPFFSPDGQWIGFFAIGNRLRKVPVAGGVAQLLGETGALSRGASWGADGYIYFNPRVGAGIHRVSENGGTPEKLTAPDLAQGEHGHQWPEVLPGGKSLLFSSAPGNMRDSRIMVLDLATREVRLLLPVGSQARYVEPGYLVFVQGEDLMAAAFDAREARVLSKPVRVLEGLAIDPSVWAAQFAVSPHGTLAYLKGGVSAASRTLVWADRKGGVKDVASQVRAYDQPRISPDSQRLAVTIRDANIDLWILEMQRGTLSRFTFAAAEDETAVWFPDGKRIAWAGDRERRSILAKAAPGGGEEEVLAHTNGHSHLNSISSDQRYLLFSLAGGDVGRPGTATSSGWDLWLLPLDGSKQPRPFLATEFNESDAMFSPDGRWVAYASDESGRSEIYVQPFPGPGGKWQVSTEGGIDPVWLAGGKELGYRNGDEFYAVPVQLIPSFSAGTPRLLFAGAYRRGISPTYGATLDGQRFIVIKDGQNDRKREIHVALDWMEEVKRAVRQQE